MRAHRFMSKPVTAVLAAVLLLLLAAAPLRAQSLPALLPSDVAFAVGLLDPGSQSERVRPFVQEAQRLDLTASLAALVPVANDMGAEAPSLDALPPVLRALPVDASQYQEAWLAVSASRFRTLPAATLIARLEPDARDAFDAAIRAAQDVAGVERREEAGSELWLHLPEGPLAAGTVPYAYALVANVAVVSTDPEIVRFAIRASAGAADRSFAGSAAWGALAAEGPAHAYLVLDLDPLLASLAPFASMYGADALLARVRDAARTAGASASGYRLGPDGIEAFTVRPLRMDGPDARLAALLARGQAPDRSVLGFAPDGALAITASHFDVAGWWAWLDDVTAAGASLGLPSATEALRLFGLDVERVLLSWSGTEAVSVTAAAPAPLRPGAVDGPLLGEEALLLSHTDAAAAKSGLREAFTLIGQTVGAFVSVTGTGSAAPVEVEVHGVPVLRLTLSDALVLDAAVLDGWVLLTAAPATTEAVLGTYASGSTGPAALQDAVSAVPAGARSWNVGDGGAALAGAADALVAQIQLSAGLAGAAALDFEAVDRASDALAAYLAFLAERVGIAVGHERVEDQAVRSWSLTRIRW